MSHAICVEVFEEASIKTAVQLLEKAVDQTKLQGDSGYISRVILLCTPHFSPFIQDLAQACVSKTNCLNVWGGCVSGLLGQRRVLSNDAAILVAVFGKEFEPSALPSGTGNSSVKLCMVELEHVLAEHWNIASTEPDSFHVQANTLGLLSYGANYAKMPRIEHGRLSGETIICATELLAHNPLILNSEGLSFLTPPYTVTQSNGLFLTAVENEKAAVALKCPDHQPRPIGLRLQVFHDKGESWIPVMDIHADGTLSLAAPVEQGQKVRLAQRTHKAIDQEIQAWGPLLKKHFNGKTPEIGVLFAGFERSQMCHADENDISSVLAAFPGTEWIGVFGQAAWLNQNDLVLTPPRNNRLSVCLFNSPKA